MIRTFQLAPLAGLLLLSPGVSANGLFEDRPFSFRSATDKQVGLNQADLIERMQNGGVTSTYFTNQTNNTVTQTTYGNFTNVGSGASVAAGGVSQANTDVNQATSGNTGSGASSVPLNFR
jgi:hypothetical protein